MLSTLVMYHKYNVFVITFEHYINPKEGAIILLIKVKIKWCFIIIYQWNTTGVK